MSAVALPRADLRPTWGQSAGAVLGGMIFGYLLSLVWYVPLAMLGVIPLDEGARTGHGWPWALDDAWALAADIGPLLLAGSCLALGIESFTMKWTGVRPQRFPLVAAAALLGWIPFGLGHTGLLGATGLVAFVGMVWVTREYSAREREPWKWTRRRAWTAVGVSLLLAAATLSYAALHPFSYHLDVQDAHVKGDAVKFSGFLHNDGPLHARVQGVEVPGHRVLALELEPSYAATDDGSTYVGLTLAAPRGCVTEPIDELVVHLVVAGHRTTQTVHTSGTDRTPCG
jgi:hypothetical protein